MRKLTLAALFIGLSLLSTAPCLQAQPVHFASLQQKQDGNAEFLAKIRLYEKSYDASGWNFVDANGNSHSLSEYKGKALIVDLWASWCRACRKELPSLGKLLHEGKIKDFAIVAINADSAPIEKVRQIFTSSNLGDMPIYRDADMKLFIELRKHGLVRGLPVSLLVNKKHQLVASISGSVNWSGKEGRQLVRELAAL